MKAKENIQPWDDDVLIRGFTKDGEERRWTYNECLEEISRIREEDKDGFRSFFDTNKDVLTILFEHNVAGKPEMFGGTEAATASEDEQFAMFALSSYAINPNLHGALVKQVREIIQQRTGKWN